MLFWALLEITLSGHAQNGFIFIFDSVGFKRVSLEDRWAFVATVVPAK